MSDLAPSERYLALLKALLTDTQHPHELIESSPPAGSTNHLIYRAASTLLAHLGLVPAARVEFNPADRAVGRDWPAQADTMIGLKRLDNVHECIRQVLADRVPGDFIETGVWRGGTTIFMRAALTAYGDETRSVWVADSFMGLPPPVAERYPADAEDQHYKQSVLAISQAEVAKRFETYGLLDERVKFLAGWFSDTLPTAPIERLAVMRLDGNMYGSTMDAVRALYPKLAPGGYVIVDDYGAMAGCREAIADYRSELAIDDPIETIDWTGVFWRKSS